MRPAVDGTAQQRGGGAVSGVATFARARRGALLRLLLAPTRWWALLMFVRNYDLASLFLPPSGARGVSTQCERCPNSCCGPEHLHGVGYLDTVRVRAAGFSHALEMDGDRAAPVLRKAADGNCCLLDANGRCAAYEHRPEGCRAFPLLVGRDRRRLVLATSCPTALQTRADKATARAMRKSARARYRGKFLDRLLAEFCPQVLRDFQLGP